MKEIGARHQKTLAQSLPDGKISRLDVQHISTLRYSNTTLLAYLTNIYEFQGFRYGEAGNTIFFHPFSFVGYHGRGSKESRQYNCTQFSG